MTVHRFSRDADLRHFKPIEPMLNSVRWLTSRKRENKVNSTATLPSETAMILLIDNYDSFTYNLVQRLGEIDPSLELEVHRNDQITLDEIERRSPSHIIISPGPCTPDEAGISVDCVKRFAGRVPILGVCLGHQSIGQAFGGKIVRADRLMHGKVDSIYHDNQGLFEGLENPFQATRYHSLVIRPDTLSHAFVVCAWSVSPDGTRVIMGIRHKEYPLYGLQFHPESFLTEVGPVLLKRFLEMRRPV
jgi:anthranilate synthase/aminodeoxychorismate synthase-like glutamine amidotransferase